MCDVKYVDDLVLVVDPIDDSVGAAPGTVASRQRAKQRFADLVRPLSQPASTELHHGRGHSLGQALSNSTSGGPEQLDSVGPLSHPPPVVASGLSVPDRSRRRAFPQQVLPATR